MTYKKLLIAGREMSEKEIAANIRGLATDPRFAAVVALIDRIKMDTVETASQVQNAPHAGILAHGMGAVNGLDILLGRIRRETDEPKKVDRG